jgi:hypothetical protein
VTVVELAVECAPQTGRSVQCERTPSAGQLVHPLRPFLRVVREWPYAGWTFDRLADREGAWAEVENWLAGQLVWLAAGRCWPA